MKTTIIFFLSLFIFLTIFGQMAKEAHESEIRWKERNSINLHK